MGSNYSEATLKKSIWELEMEDELETAAQQHDTMRTLSSIVERWLEIASGKEQV